MVGALGFADEVLVVARHDAERKAGVAFEVAHIGLSLDRFEARVFVGSQGERRQALFQISFTSNDEALVASRHAAAEEPRRGLPG